MRRLALFVASLALVLAASLPARAAFETRASAAWVYDLTTDTVLLAKNADIPLPPASMSKLMTLDMLFEALADGRVQLDTRFSVSTKARQMGGSTLFLDETDRPTAEELIKGIIVQSGNDACVVVAEGLAGTEEAFARAMTERAREIGLTQTTLVNASGWPDPRHRMSMQDLGRLAVRLITEFPQYYGYFALSEWPYDGRAPQNRFNRNPLLRLGIGADGLKTGHTAEAGFGLVGSAVQGERRVVFVITGLASDAERAEEAERIVNWAFRQFVERKVAAGGTALATADVWMGRSRSVGLMVPQGASVLLPAGMRGEIAAEIVHATPLVAPIAQGDEVARLVIRREGLAPAEFALVAAEDVPEGGVLVRLSTAARVLLGRAFSGIGGI